MYRVFTVLILVNILIPLTGSKYKDKDATDTNKTTSKNDDVVFRVFNGIPAKLGEIPYQVSLKLPVRRYVYKSFCGGSVIGQSRILTAAHCVTQDGNVCQKLCKKFKMKSVMKMFVVAGTLRNSASYQADNKGSEQWRKITDVAVPPGYWFPKNDISVLNLEFPFVFNAYVQPLPFASRTVEYGTMQCVASGFGKIDNYQTSEVLLWTNLRLIPSYRCSAIHKKNMNKFICTASEVTNVLQGDSGGPLVCQHTGDYNDRGKGVIVGVVSGASIKRHRQDTFFTRVSSFSRFVSHGDAAVNTPVFYTVLLALIIPTFY